MAKRKKIKLHIGIEVEGSLSKVDIGACLREIVPMSRGIVKDTRCLTMAKSLNIANDGKCISRIKTKFIYH